MANEPWDWGKALSGLVDPVRFLKSCFMGLQILIVGVIVYVLFVGGVALWKKWIPQPKVKQPMVQTTGNITGGDKSRLDMSSGDQTTKWGVITF